MKIASYNVMSGGFNSYNYDEVMPPRLDLIVEAVNKLGADFVSLIDTFRWDEVYSENDLKSIFGYKYSYCVNLEDKRLIKLGHNNGLTVLTNEHAVKFEIIRLFNRNGIKTVIHKNNKSIDLYTVYLDDLLESTRRREIYSLLMQMNPSNPAVIMGDLNTMSPKDVSQFIPEIRRFLDDNPQITKFISPFLNEIQKAKVISDLENAGFSDSNVSSETTAPTSLFEIKNIPPLLRLDYILTNKLNYHDFKVYKKSFFEKVSDHYPISVDIEL